MIFNDALHDLPRPVWGFDEDQDAETLCLISIEVGAWFESAAGVEACEVDDSRNIQSLCRQMAKHFCSLHNPEDEDQWTDGGYCEEIDSYIHEVLSRLALYPDWINSDFCAASGRQTVIDLLAKPKDSCAAFGEALHAYMKARWMLDDEQDMKDLVAQRWPITDTVEEFGDWWANRQELLDPKDHGL